MFRSSCAHYLAAEAVMMAWAPRREVQTEMLSVVDGGNVVITEQKKHEQMETEFQQTVKLQDDDDVSIRITVAFSLGSVAQWLGRRSVAGGVSLIYADLWLTCDHFVGKASAMGQTTRPTQPSIPSGLVNE